MKGANVLWIVVFAAVLAFATSALSQVREGRKDPGSGQHNPGSGQAQKNPESGRHPGSGQKNPGFGQHNPGTGQHNPGFVQPNPGTAKPNPGTGQKNPGSGQHNPGTGQHNPGSGQKNPGSGWKNPGSGQHNPGSGQHNPGTGQHNPGTGQKNPGNGHNPESGHAQKKPGSSHNPGSGHFTTHYGNQHGNPKWDKHRWESSWNRHWYHQHPVWRNNGLHWWDPTVSRYVVYQQGVTLPEDEYVRAYSQPAPPVASGASIRILNPAGATATLGYAINGDSFQIRPGETQSLPAGRSWVIEFDRGDPNGSARYTLQAGQQYQFASTAQGWDLQQLQGP